MIKRMLFSLLAVATLIVSPGWPLPPEGLSREHVDFLPFSTTAATATLIPASQLRVLAVHNAGQIDMPISTAGFPAFRYAFGTNRDPETGLMIRGANSPTGTDNQYVFAAGLWIGGIVDGDTTVSTAYDTWWTGLTDFFPEVPELGGVYRSGDYADDEFVCLYTDTVDDPPYVTWFNPYSDTSHIPLGLKITQHSYSWADTLYDNFVIFDFTVKNILNKDIDSAWVGVIMDPDIYKLSGDYSMTGYQDDASGYLDTLLYDDDPDSRVVIPYCMDMDGDPALNMTWIPGSVRGAVSIALLETSFPVAVTNFNWWLANNDTLRDFGPRRVGTPEDPFRRFAGGFLGAVNREQDNYYIMAHQERDYHELEMGVHDSADGWVSPYRSMWDLSHDTKFLYSFGPVDLPPGDSIAFAFAIVISDGLHARPRDFVDHYTTENPSEYLALLDFTDMLTLHRRADSVYKSGLMLPKPGPPVGLAVTGHSNNYIDLAWSASHNQYLNGYNVYVKDTVYDNLWRRVNSRPVSDSHFRFPVTNPTHRHFFAVTKSDIWGRESTRSEEISFIPARPPMPTGVSAILDGLIPVVSWIPYSDTALMAYMIYRSEWTGPSVLYDSVSALTYRDLDAESGVQYNYRIAAKNREGFESAPAGPATAIPMAMDKGILFYNMNYDHSVHVDPYHRRYVDRLINAVQPIVDMDYHAIENGILTFKRMADYSLVIMDSEMRGGKIRREAADSLRYYLAGGGKAFIITGNVTIDDIGMLTPDLSYCTPGSFLHDYLKLDSAVTNAIVLQGGFIRGDLMGCRPEDPTYPTLTSDSSKIVESAVPIYGYLPMAGFMYPDDEVEVLYRYQSMYPDSLFHEQVNGIRYLGDDFSFVLFNFQLSLMKAPGNIEAFRRGLADLGVNISCGDINDDGFLDVGDIIALLVYIYNFSEAVIDESRADVNCDGGVDVLDALVLINAVFRNGPPLECCP